MPVSIGFLMVLLLAFGFAPNFAMAAGDPATTPAAPPTEGTKEWYDLEKAKYEAEKAANDAKKAALESKFPSDAVTKSTGALTQTGETLPIAEQLALRAGAKLGQGIGDKAKGESGALKILVTSRSDFAEVGAESTWFMHELARRKEIAAQVKIALQVLLVIVQQRAKEIPSTKGAGGLLAADALLKGAVNLLGYFKSDFDIKSVTVTPQDEVLFSAITSKLGAKAFREGWLLPPKVPKVFQALDALSNELVDASDTAAALKLSEKDLNESEKAALAEYVAVIIDNATFVSSAAQRAADGKPGVLQRVIAGETISSAGLTHILFAKFVAAGGSGITRKNLFQLNPRLAYVGTATVVYTLTDVATGTIQASGVGTCAWPMRIALHEVAKNIDQFNADANLNCQFF